MTKPARMLAAAVALIPCLPGYAAWAAHGHHAPPAGTAKIRQISTVPLAAKALAPTPDGERLTSAKLQAYIETLQGVMDAKAANKPAFVYFYTNATETAVNGNVRPTFQADTCRNYERQVFNGTNISVGITAKFFVCTKVDVSAVSPQDNPFFNTMNAPTVLITSSDGVKVALLTRQIGRYDVVSPMTKAMQKSGIDAWKNLREGDRLVRKIGFLEDEKERFQKTMASTAGEVAKAEAAGSTELGALKERQERLKERVQKIETDLAAAYERLKALSMFP